MNTSARHKKYAQVIKVWAAMPGRKPMLAYGPTMSGKKTMLRDIFVELGYTVITPSHKSALQPQQDRGIIGKHAFIMNTAEVGMKKLSGTKTAPIVYVCIDRYKLGKKKDELQKEYELLDISTGKDYSKSPATTRDIEFTPFSAVDAIIGKPGDILDVKLRAIESVGPYMRQIVHYTVMSDARIKSLPSGLGLDMIARDCENMSTADIFDRHTPDAIVVTMSCIAPIVDGCIKSSMLQMTKPHAPKSAKLVIREGNIMNKDWPEMKHKKEENGGFRNEEETTTQNKRKAQGTATPKKRVKRTTEAATDRKGKAPASNSVPRKVKTKV